ncbi:hypothetical protein [Nocardioides sp.]|uniref:hypothetical protein n=1 Tax=Nocardioides sp. TaxID=35761 RepID=UPI0026177D05|nr:hypothetical protein [Nocardioides sp.]
MSSSTSVSQARVLGLTVLFVALVAAVVSAVLMIQHVEAQPRSIRIGDTAGHAGWQTVGYGDVQVSIPGDWKRLDIDGCESKPDAWAPKDTPACDLTTSITFVGDTASFDPIGGPGVVTDPDGNGHHAGYQVVGRIAVTAEATDADEVREILDSVAHRVAP